MATRRPFWKWRQCKSIAFYPYTQRLCYWTLELIFKAKLKVESGNQNILNGHQAAILKWRHWKSIGYNQHVYEIWNWNSTANLTYAPQTMSSADGLMDRPTDGWGVFDIPPYNFNACRCCSYYIFILDFTPCFNRLHKDNCKTRRETFKFWDLVHLISDWMSD